MNWIAQVGHVSAKDLRYARWSFLALIVTLTIATRSFVTRDAFGPIVNVTASSNTMTLAMSEVTVTWLPLVVVVVGIIALAVLVQADRPLQPDSFWTTRPLAPTAVLVSKLSLGVIAIVLPPLVAASVALSGLHTPRSVATGMLAHAALAYVSLLLATILVAALTDDMKGFVTGAVVALGSLLVSLVLIDQLFPGAPDVPAALAFVAPVVAIVLLIFLYRGRTSGTGKRAAGLGVAVLLIIGTSVAPDFQISHVPIRATGPRLSLTFGAPAKTSMILPFVVRVEDTSSARFAFAREQTVISGGHETVNLTPLHDTLVLGATFPDLGRSIRWLSSPVALPSIDQLAVSPADSHAVARGATLAQLSGMVTELRPRVLATLPLRDGAFAEKEGSFVSIYGVSHDSARVSVYVHTAYPPVADRHSLQFVVANLSRGEAILLDEHPSVGNGGGWIVLPWIRVTSAFEQVSTSSSTVVPRDSSWYAGASLLAIDWIPVARYRTSATMRLR